MYVPIDSWCFLETDSSSRSNIGAVAGVHDDGIIVDCRGCRNRESIIRCDGDGGWGSWEFERLYDTTAKGKEVFPVPLRFAWVCD